MQFPLQGSCSGNLTQETASKPPADFGKLVIAGTLEGSLFAVNSLTGKEQWRYKTDGQISGAPNRLILPHNGGSEILAGSYDYNLHCINGETGKPIWKYETANYINGTPALFGKICIFGGCDGHLYLVNTDNGQLIEKIDISTYMASSPAIGGNKAWFGNYDGEFFCFDLRKKRCCGRKTVADRSFLLLLSLATGWL